MARRMVGAATTAEAARRKLTNTVANMVGTWERVLIAKVGWKTNGRRNNDGRNREATKTTLKKTQLPAERQQALSALQRAAATYRNGSRTRGGDESKEPKRTTWTRRLNITPPWL